MPSGISTPNCTTAVASRNRLLQWFDENRRELPWRPTPPHLPRDPYAVWVSEVMLQQTQVAVVIDRYQHWMEQLPTLGHLANAPSELVLQLWRGLGYYARARNLQKGAQQIVEQFDGEFPTTRKELEAIAGIGPYSAGAILSLAFGQQEPIVDGNLFRIFSRLCGWNVARDNREKMQEAWRFAALWSEHPTPGVVNEALMELGALVCTPRNPSCSSCPLKSNCRTFEDGEWEKRPSPRQSKKAVEVVRTWIVAHHSENCRQDECYLMVPPESDPDNLLKQQWQIPSLKGEYSQERLAKCLKINSSKIVMMGTIRHTITHHRISGVVARVEDIAALKRLFPTAKLKPPSAFHHSLGTKILAAANQKNSRP